MDFSEIVKKGVPNHIAIILDGNGRWAKKRLLPRTMGHRQGAMNLKDIAAKSNEIGIKYLTVFCFSTENWSRPESEVNYLMKTPIKYYNKYKDKILSSNIRIRVIGRRDRLSQELLNVILDIEEKTKDKTGLTLILCIDYGSQDEIVTATKKIAQKIIDKSITIEEISSKMIEQNLYTAEFPPLDLLIRTSGEIRISNFLLWQLAYSELYFTNAYWPDFDELELYKAIESYQLRSRRFGGLKENK